METQTKMETQKKTKVKWNKNDPIKMVGYCHNKKCEVYPYSFQGNAGIEELGIMRCCVCGSFCYKEEVSKEEKNKFEENKLK